MVKTELNSLNASKTAQGSLGGKDIYSIILRNGQMEVELLNIGCAIMAIRVPDKAGTIKNVVAGLDNIADYAQNPWYFGCVVGRYANRISNGRFELDGKTVQLSLNEGSGHLHGGRDGFHKKVWDIIALTDNNDEAGVTLEYFSCDGEEGYPGNLRVRVSYTLNTKNQFTIHYLAETDKATPVSLTNHSYFNLTGFEHPTVTGHILEINAREYTEKNEWNLPSGKRLPVADTPLDFSAAKPIGRDISCFEQDVWFDHNYILPVIAGQKMVFAAQLSEPAWGRVLRVFTNAPGMQLYTANLWDGSIGAAGKRYVKHGAVALETQAFPDSPNHPAFPDTIVRPGKPYRSTTMYVFETTETICRPEGAKENKP